MKTRKKILLGLGIIIFIFSFVLPATSVFAATKQQWLNSNVTAKFINVTTIQVTVPATGQTFNFVTDQPGGNQYKYSGPSVDGTLCPDGEGITFQGNGTFGPDTVGPLLAQINVTVQEGSIGSNNLNCGSGNDVKRSINVVLPADIAAQGPGAGAGGTADASNTCEAKWSSPLTWIACPLFAIATGLTDSLISLFKDQLCFRTEASNNAAIKCDVTDTDSIKPAWSAIKNIVSALLVVIMLVAIFAQAVSVGPIDTYTIRKMLPRLIAAVILIQISWYLFSWVINTVDNIGEGLMNLFDTIFANASGGVNINDFYELLANAGVGIGTLAAANWVALITIVGFGIAALPALLLLVFSAVVALLVGLAVLIFRKVMIITLLLVAPIALLLWVLPNTDRYWKMWWDNFLKVLLMFPIAVVIIEAGRMFAYVAGTSSGGGFIGLLLVMVGFFGPLLILPKTFSWGGSLMQTAGQSITKAGRSAAKPGEDYLNWRKGMSRWNTARNMRRGILERQAKTDFARGLSMQGGKGVSGKLRGIQGGINRARLGGVSTKEGEIRHKALQSAQAEVAKVYEEELGAADAELTQTVLPNFDRGQQDIVREAIALGQTKKVTDLSGRTFDFDGAEHAKNHPMHQRAALNRALIHGQMGVVDQYYTEAIESGDQRRIQEAEFFKQANAQALGEKLPHILKGYGVAAGSSEEAISKMHGHEIESIIAHFSSKAAAGDTDAAEALNGFLQRYQNARDNDNLRGNLDVRGITAVDSFTGAYKGDKSAAAIVDDINTGSLKKAKAASEGKDPNGLQVDREGNRSRYRSPGVDPKKSIPLITIPPAGTLNLPEPASGGTVTATAEVQVHPRPVWRQGAAGGTRVSETGLDIPDSSGWTPREDAYAENDARNEYNSLRNRMGSGEALSPDEQRRLQQYRDSHPDW
jgi:hypothetical protein